MPTRPFRLTALLVCASMTTSCAGFVPRSVQDAPEADPPQVQAPAEVLLPCLLATLPPAPTNADRDTIFAERGLGILQCDTKRELAVLALQKEHDAMAAWKIARDCRRTPVWKFWVKLSKTCRKS